MNIKLDCYVNRREGKRGYLIEKDGVVLERHLFRCNPVSSMKSLILVNMLEGIKNVRKYVSHEEVLSIVLQNKDVVSWVTDRNESRYKDHISVMDSIFDTIEELDCRVHILFSSKSGAKRFVDNSYDFDKEEVMSLEEAFSDLAED